MKKIKVCSIILTVLSVIGICLSIIKLIAQYNGFAILKHSGEQTVGSWQLRQVIVS